MTHMPLAHYLVVPQAPCESWQYLPVKFTHAIAPGSYWTIEREAQLYHFGIMSSAMYMAWVKCVSGRLNCHDRHIHKPSIRNFPWPINHTQAQLVAIETRALDILTVRAKYADMTLEELYSPLTMPSALYEAHMALDKAVDAAYCLRRFDSDHSRIGFLFNYDRQISAMLITKALPEATESMPVYQPWMEMLHPIRA